MEDNKVKDGSYINIQSFMINDLHLKGNDLLIYAIIYGFSQDGETRFTGSLSYLAAWTQSSKQGVLKSLKKLVELGYIKKIERYNNGIKFCEYYSTQLTGVLNSVDRGIKQSLTGGIKQSLPNNIDINNIDNNKDNNIEIEGKPSRSRFTPPTLEEVKDYCRERNNHIDAEKFIDYYQARGWELGKGRKMKDWRAAVRTWERNNYGSKKPASHGGYKQGSAEDLENFYKMAKDWANT